MKLTPLRVGAYCAAAAFTLQPTSALAQPLPLETATAISAVAPASHAPLLAPTAWRLQPLQALASAPQAGTDPASASFLPPPAVQYATTPDPDGLRAILEFQAVFFTGFLYYVSTSGLEKEWGLNYSWETYRRKLDGSHFGIDHNHLGTNFIGHPLGGAGYYHAARSNQFGIYESFAFAIGGSFLWEYFGEIREVVSLNDSLVTPMAGLAIGESLFQLGAFFDRSGPEFPNPLLAGLFSPFKAANDAWDDIEPRRASSGYPKNEWHEFDLQAGLFVVQEHASPEYPSTTVSEGRIRLSERLARFPSFDRAGNHALSFGEAEASGMQLDLAFSNSGLSNLRIDTQVVFGGRYFRQAEETPSGLWGAGGYVGVGSGYEYSARDLHRTRNGRMDRIASVQPLVLVAQYHANLGELTLDSYVDAGPNFAGITNHALDDYAGAPETLPIVMQLREYYMGFGAHGTAKARARFRRLELSSELRAESYRSLDTKGHEIQVPLLDTRSSFESSVGYRVPNSPALIRLSFERRRRGSTMGDQYRLQTESAAGVNLAGLF